MPAEPGPGRRFPQTTTGTARPEGGGRAVGPGRSAPARQWPLLTVLGGVALGLLLTWTGPFRAGLVIIGSAMLLGAVLRRVVPSVGMLAVRSRFTDLITYSVIGTAIVLLALMAQPQPVLNVPFLDGFFRFLLRE